MESCVVQNPSIISDLIRVDDVQSNICNGKILQERNEAWICGDDSVHIINVNSGVTTQKWKCNYGKVYLSTEVVCHSHQFIVVAARVSLEASSVVIVLKVSSLMVVKVIFLPDEITAISSVTIKKERDGISSRLAYFDGILSIGSYGGRVYLLDMDVSQSHSQGPVYHPSSIKVIDDKAIPETSVHGEHSALLLFQGNNSISETVL